MVNERTVTLIERLHQRTMEGKILWEQTDKDSVFQVAFPEYSLKVFQRQSGEYDTFIVLKIFNKDGVLIEEIYQGQLIPQLPASVMEELYDTARRIAMGVDKAIDDILAELD